MRKTSRKWIMKVQKSFEAYLTESANELMDFHQMQKLWENFEWKK